MAKRRSKEDTSYMVVIREKIRGVIRAEASWDAYDTLKRAKSVARSVARSSAEDRLRQGGFTPGRATVCVVSRFAKGGDDKARATVCYKTKRRR